jgi:hypothetical protein
MDNLIATLRPDQLVVDIGCGHGSFDYRRYPCRILAIDIHFDKGLLPLDGSRVSFVRASSEELPLSAASADVIVCNHSLEHIAQYKQTLAEIRRVLKDSGVVWISVPNGFGFDDALYRFLYEGGGHVNRFSFDGLVNDMEQIAGLKLLQWTRLTSCFIYCKQPRPTDWPYLPRRVKFFHKLPASGAIVFALNTVTRLADKLLKSRLSMYGWGFVFGSRGTIIDCSLPSYFNVCLGCGSGHPIAALQSSAHRHWGVQFYRCPRCAQTNPLFLPPAGCE